MIHILTGINIEKTWLLILQSVEILMWYMQNGM